MKKIIILFLLITSCAAPSLDKRIDYINELNNTKFTEFVYQDTFAIYSLQKINNNEEVVVYVVNKFLFELEDVLEKKNVSLIGKLPTQS